MTKPSPELKAMLGLIDDEQYIEESGGILGPFNSEEARQNLAEATRTRLSERWAQRRRGKR